MKTINKILFLLGLIGLIFTGCVNQDFDEPPSNCSQINYTANITAAQLKQMMAGKDTMRVDTDLIFEGTVISSDQYGNFYKELYLQDSTGGIILMLDLSYMFTKYPVGQKVYVLLKDLYLKKDYGQIYVGNTYEQYGVVKVGRLQGEAFIDQHVIKTCENEEVTPKELKITQVSDAYLDMLVKITDVQFSDQDTGQTWANAIADPPEDMNHNLTDVDLNTLIVRTSGYATFASEKVPSGSGYIIGVLTKYRDDYQLYIRSLQDVQMDNPRFGYNVVLVKDFSDGSLYSGGWLQKKVVGNINWEYASGYGNPPGCATISNYVNGTHEECETWYISPSIDLSANTNPVLNFDNACNYSGANLQVKVSTDYDGVSDPSSATWTDLNATLSTGGWAWVNSGDISLANYKESNVHIAFVYTGSSSDGKTWEIDNIRVEEK